MKKHGTALGGISVSPAQQNAVQGVAVRIFREILLYFVALLTTGGMLLSALTAIDAAVGYLPVILAAAGITLVCFALLRFIKKIWAALLPYYAVIAALFGIFWRSFVIGAAVIYDDIMRAVCASMDWTAPQAIAQKTGAYTLYSSIFILICFAALAPFAVYFSTRRPSLVFTVIFTLPIAAGAMAFGCVPDIMSFAALISGYIAVLTLNITAKNKTASKEKTGGKGAGSKIIYSQNDASYGAVRAVCAALAAIVVFCGVSAALGFSGFARSDELNRLRHNIKYTAADIFDYVTGEDRDGSLKEGRLYKTADLKIKRRHYLTLQTDIEQGIFLKGYVGEGYNGREWIDIDADTDSIDKLRSLGIYVSSMQGSIMGLQNSSNLSGSIKISDMRRKKDYSYTAYGAYAATDVEQIGDKNLNFGGGSYSYTAYYINNILYDLSDTALMKNSDVKNALADYEKYVHTQYTALPESLPDTVKNAVEAQGDIYDKITAVRDYLSSQAQYSYYSAKLPNNADFTEYFLFTQKHGSSSHFATAAAVLLRNCGVACRYAEGYYIPKSVLEENFDGELSAVDVTDEFAHAWVEAYFDGYGWMPVEVTPGFYSGAFSLDEQTAKTDKPEPEQSNKNQTEAENSENDIPLPEKVTDPREVEQVLKRAEVFLIEPYMIWLAAGALAALIIAVFIICFAVRRRRLQKRLTLGGTAERMTALYKYYKRLIKFENLSFDTAKSYSQAAKIAASGGCISPAQSEQLISLFVKFGFSGGPPSESDYGFAKELTLRFADEIYKQSGRRRAVRILKRFKFKYINVLLIKRK